MKIMLEVTDWQEHAVPNHVYVFNDSLTQAIAYVPAGSHKLQKFSKPLDIDTRGRKFVELEGQDTAHEPNVIEVQGSKGQIYWVHTVNRTCSCPGFKYRAHCRHIPQ